MRFRPEAGIAVVLLALVAIWPFWHERSANGAAVSVPGSSSPVALPEAGSSLSGASRPGAGTGNRDTYVCTGCVELRRLAGRLKEREEGAARRFGSAARALSRSSSGGEDRSQLEVALRRARDDKRGAAAFRAATLEAVRACESGPGCGDVALAAYWPGGCPPEHPDLAREVRTLAALHHALSRKLAACAAAACPEVGCGRLAQIRHLLSQSRRSFRALVPTAEGPETAATRRRESEALRGLLDEAAAWRGETAAVFLGAQDPAAQIAASAKSAASLAERLSKARADAGGSARRGDPFWRVQVLAARLSEAAGALHALAAAVERKGADRGAAMAEARRRAAAAFRDVLITQMRIRSARETVGRSNTEEIARCDRRRRRQIERAAGQIEAMRAASVRCGARAACTKKSRKKADMASAPELDPVSAQRLRLDLALDALGEKVGALSVGAQKPVRLETDRSRYQSGGAVSVRINLDSTACMADSGSWVGLFPERAARVRGAEAGALAIRQRKLRGRPWEEFLFEAPRRPGAYEVRAFTSRLRGGAVTGSAKFAVVAREEGCRGFTGTWRTNFGRLRITVHDGEASGSYKKRGAWRAGFLTGEVKGRVLYGQWQSELGGGGTRLVLSKDGKSFKGTWSHFRDEFAGTGLWKGTCEGPARRQPQPDTE